MCVDIAQRCMFMQVSILMYLSSHINLTLSLIGYINHDHNHISISHEVRLFDRLSLTFTIQSWVAIHRLSFSHITQSVKTIPSAQSSLNTQSHISSFPHLFHLLMKHTHHTICIYFNHSHNMSQCICTIISSQFKMPFHFSSIPFLIVNHNSPFS